MEPRLSRWTHSAEVAYRAPRSKNPLKVLFQPQVPDVTALEDTRYTQSEHLIGDDPLLSHCKGLGTPQFTRQDALIGI